MANSAPLQSLKCILSTPPALGLPDGDKPFCLHCLKNDGAASGILGQAFASQLCPGAYSSCRSESLVPSMPLSHLAHVRGHANWQSWGSNLPRHSSMFSLLCLLSYKFTGLRTSLPRERPPMSRLNLPITSPGSHSKSSPFTPLPAGGEPHSIPHHCLATAETVSKPRDTLSDVLLRQPRLTSLLRWLPSGKFPGKPNTWLCHGAPWRTLEWRLSIEGPAPAAERRAHQQRGNHHNMLLESDRLLAQFGDPESLNLCSFSYCCWACNCGCFKPPF